ncbi:hypothetical protein [Croceicoccus mobilis]|uniref:hypothetical protein n=1 Tax=Croceicoccus mobilis TaxID=1703339 RepID=UPI0012E963EE|nr:hypothetical protein [Croceicoccus mobilis]
MPPISGQRIELPDLSFAFVSYRKQSLGVPFRSTTAEWAQGASRAIRLSTPGQLRRWTRVDNPRAETTVAALRQGMLSHSPRFTAAAVSRGEVDKFF